MSTRSLAPNQERLWGGAGQRRERHIGIDGCTWIHNIDFGAKTKVSGASYWLGLTGNLWAETFGDSRLRLLR